MSEVRTSHRSWISLILLLLSPFILYGLFVLYGDLSAKYAAYQHVQWLTDFYVKNAPEVDELFLVVCRKGGLVYCSFPETQIRPWPRCAHHEEI